MTSDRWSTEQRRMRARYAAPSFSAALDRFAALCAEGWTPAAALRELGLPSNAGGIIREICAKRGTPIERTASKRREALVDRIRELILQPGATRVKVAAIMGLSHQRLKSIMSNEQITMSAAKMLRLASVEPVDRPSIPEPRIAPRSPPEPEDAPPGPCGYPHFRGPCIAARAPGKLRCVEHLKPIYPPPVAFALPARAQPQTRGYQP